MEKLYRKIIKSSLENNNYIIFIISEKQILLNDFIYSFSKFLYNNYPNIYTSKYNEIKFFNNSKVITNISYNRLRGYRIDEIYNYDNINNKQIILYYELFLKNQWHKRKELSIFFRNYIKI